jgi:hypothetical protein
VSLSSLALRYFGISWIVAVLGPSVTAFNMVVKVYVTVGDGVGTEVPTNDPGLYLIWMM